MDRLVDQFYGSAQGTEGTSVYQKEHEEGSLVSQQNGLKVVLVY